MTSEDALPPLHVQRMMWLHKEGIGSESDIGSKTERLSSSSSSSAIPSFCSPVDHQRACWVKEEPMVPLRCPCPRPHPRLPPLPLPLETQPAHQEEEGRSKHYRNSWTQNIKQTHDRWKLP